jgi:hypothetical protein
MATLILTAAGTALGGPIGGAIGALLGQQVDRAVIGGGRRQGPRLAELAVQTSSYGTQVAKLFGTMRVAGTVIWATDLIETRGTSGGKGRATMTYGYAANFAVLLSARAILDVRRIWADGKLLRGAAGDFKVRTGFRIHTGGEDQAADPLIAAAEGAVLTPAHRGAAYVVFEGLALAEYGNRIPSLTFEVVADDGDVASGVVVRGLAGEVVDADDGLMLGGFAASGGSVRAVLETCAQASGGWFAPAGDGLAFRTGGMPARTIADAGFGAVVGTRAIAAARTVPGTVTVAHYDVARDYQTGLQRACAPGGFGGNGRNERVDVPAVLTAWAAKAVAEAVLARGEAARVRRTVAPGLSAIDLTPGAVVEIAGEVGRWRVARASLTGWAVELDLVRIAGTGVALTASSGRVLPQADAVAGRTVLAPFEVPALDDVPLAAPRLTVAAAGTHPGWRSAALLTSINDGATWTDAGATALPAVIGRAEQPLPPGSTALTDSVGVVVVRLAHAAMQLFDADDAAIDGGANLALIGSELVQFGRAESLGEARWRVSRLLRGRRGTEWAVAEHAADEPFVLIEEGAVRTIALPAGTAAVRVIASGVGDDTPVTTAATLNGSSVRPPAVAHLRWQAEASGEAKVHWVRRSRAGWRWIDGADVPVGEEAERYVVTVQSAAATVTRTTDVTWATVVRPATVTVRQRGTHGDSRGTTIVVPA